MLLRHDDHDEGLDPRRRQPAEATVRNHLASAIGTTGARTRAEAARTADERGWL